MSTEKAVKLAKDVWQLVVFGRPYGLWGGVLRYG